jgi:UDP-glucose 4-epimerase
MTDETGIDQGDAAGGRNGGEKPRGFRRAGSGANIETQRPQVAFERRPGYRWTGEDGGRQTNSLLGTDRGRVHGDVARDSGRRRVG